MKTKQNLLRVLSPIIKTLFRKLSREERIAMLKYLFVKHQIDYYDKVLVPESDLESLAYYRKKDSMVYKIYALEITDTDIKGKVIILGSAIADGKL